MSFFKAETYYIIIFKCFPNYYNTNSQIPFPFLPTHPKKKGDNLCLASNSNQFF